MREELRLASADGTLTGDTVRLLVDGLADVRRRLVARLRD